MTAGNDAIRRRQRVLKGLPLAAGVTVTRIGELGWQTGATPGVSGSCPYEEELVHNITTMADYCRHHRVELAYQAYTWHSWSATSLPVAAADPATD